MEKHQIHRMVEYIRIQPEFPFDGIDVHDSLEEVLSYFGLHPQLDDDARAELLKEMLPLAWAAEEAEMARLAEESDLAGLMHPSVGKRAERCTPEGVPSLAAWSMNNPCVPLARQVVSPFFGGNAP